WAYSKTLDGWLTGGAPLEEVLASYLPQSEPTYGRFLESFVLPNADLFARLVTVGEWAVALALTLGFFTRLGSLIGMWLTANFLLMRGILDVSGTIDHVFFLACLVCLIASAGEAWGLDGLLRKPDRKRPVANTWANPRATFEAIRPPRPRPMYITGYGQYGRTLYS